MNWLFLVIAGIFEIVWAVALKYSNGFTKFWPATITVVSMAISIYFLALAVKSLPIGTAYAIWTGIGVLGTVIFGILIFKEPVTFLRMFFLFLLISSIIGLKLTAR